MMDIPSQFNEPILQSPGEQYQYLANEVAELALLLGWHMTPKAKLAAAVLIQEGEDWWKTSNNARDISAVIALMRRLVK